MIGRVQKKQSAERRCGEHRLNAAAIKGAILCQRNMLIPPLCEQLIGYYAANQAVREGKALGLDASVWHCVHHRPHLAAPSHLGALVEKRIHFCQLSLPASACTAKGCRERDSSSISKLQRLRPEQRYSLIVTYDLLYI